MKLLLPALCTATLFATLPLRAQEGAAAPAATSPVSAPESVAPDAVSETSPSAPPARPAAPEPTLDLMPAQPTQTLPAPSTPISETEPSLIPEAPTTNPKSRGSAIEPPSRIGVPEGKEKKQKKSATEISNNELQTRIRFRQAKTRALGDPAIQAEWDKSVVAHTDFEKRAALKRFYTMLYARMGKLDGTLKKEIDERQRVSLKRLDQTRIEATEEPISLADRSSRLDAE